MTRFVVTDLRPAGLKLVERTLAGDERGFFARLFCSDALRPAGWKGALAQVNHSCTRKRGTVRGLHFQWPPHAEDKLVTCIRGEIWDVAVDLRVASPTFLHWHAEHLSADNRRAFLIPKGFAHGFQSLTDDVDIIYCHSEPYAASADSGLNPKDPRLDISWPLEIAEMSARDSGCPLLKDDFAGISVE